MWEALNGRRDIWGQEHPDTLTTMADLGWLYHSQGHYEKAESRFDEVLKTARRVLGEAHVTTADALHGLGTLYLSQGRHDEAQPLLEKALEIVQHLLGEEGWAALEVTNTLARLYTAQGRYDEAGRLSWAGVVEWACPHDGQPVGQVILEAQKVLGHFAHRVGVVGP